MHSVLCRIAEIHQGFSESTKGLLSSGGCILSWLFIFVSLYRYLEWVFSSLVVFAKPGPYPSKKKMGKESPKEANRI